MADIPDSLTAQIPAIASAINPTLHSAVAESPADTRFATAALRACFDFAPGAPEELIVEASIRYAAWLSGVSPNIVRRSLTTPDGTALDVAFAASVGGSSPMRRSGASSILAPYRSPTALPVSS